MLEASSIEHGYLYIYTCLPIQRAIYFNIPSDSSGFTRLLPLNLLYLWFPAFPLLRYLRNYIISEFSLGPKLPPFTFYMTMYASYSGLLAEGWDEWKHLLVATPVLGFLMQTVHIAVWDAVGPRLYAALGVDYEGFIAAQEASSDPAYKREEEHT